MTFQTLGVAPRKALIEHMERHDINEYVLQGDGQQLATLNDIRYNRQLARENANDTPG